MASAKVTGSVLFYVQHLLGIGHLRRALRIVEALTHEGIKVTLASGGEPLPELASASAERVVQLVPISARDSDFKELVDTAGRSVDDNLQSARREQLLAAFEIARPDALLIEAFPFGRRAFRFELDALIDAARSHDPRALVLCSLRDIIVNTDAKRSREIIDRVRAHFDFVLVHGDPDFIPLNASFSAASEIEDRLIYTGYVGDAKRPGEVSREVDSNQAVGRDEVVVSVGGGAVGGTLLSVALETRRQGCLADTPWRLLGGPNLSEAEFAALAESLTKGMVLERYRPDFREILGRCLISVSQAGYNTVLDVLRAGIPAVLVPFESERETEQILRANQLAARGAFEVVREAELSPQRLARAIHSAISRGPASAAIDTRGARRTAAVIAELIRSRTGAPGRASENLLLYGSKGYDPQMRQLLPRR